MELITVLKSQIGQNVVNVVNARDLHSKLEVKTPFSMWIQRAIEKYGFEENTDFTIHKFVIGKAKQIDYFTTLEMGKELCMLDDSNYGKLFRKYFIECEKQTLAIKPLSNDEKLQVIAQSTIQISEKVEKHDIEIELLKNDICLSSAQKRQLQISVNHKVASFTQDNSQKRKLYKKVWGRLYDKYAVASYMEIPRLKFEEAKNIVDSLTLLDVAVG
jgi:phage anti-repressor protein